MISEGVTVVDAEHQEEHGATDKHIPSERSTQYETLGINTRKAVQKASRSPDCTTKEGLSPPPPAASPQLAQRWRANQSQVASSMASSKELLVKGFKSQSRDRRRALEATEWWRLMTFSRWERLSEWESLRLQCWEGVALSRLLHKELKKSALFQRQNETATAADTTWRTGRKTVKVCLILTYSIQ